MYTLAWHKSFKHSYKKLIKKNLLLKEKTIETLTILQNDPFDNKLKTHKLHGILKDYFACCIDFNYRIVFLFEKIDKESIIALVDIGTHDEVY